MPQIVEIPGVGEAEFPDDYSQDQIAGILRERFPKTGRLRSAASTLAQAIESGIGTGIQGFANIPRQISAAMTGGDAEAVQTERNTIVDSLARLSQREREGRMTPELTAARTELESRLGFLESQAESGPVTEALYGAGEAIRKDAVTRFQPNPAYRDEFFAGTVPQVAGSAIQSVTPFLMSPGIGVANMAGQVFQDTYEENLAKGVPQDEAARRALMNGIVSGGLESVSGGVVANIAKRLAGTSIRDMAPAALRSVVQGGVTEFLTGAAQETAGQIINEEQIDPAEIAKQGGLEALGSLFITGPAVGVGAITDRLARDRRPTITESEAAASLGVDPLEIAPEPEPTPAPEPTEAQRVDSEIASLNSELERALQRRRLSNDDEVRSQAWTEAQAIDARLQEAESRRRNLGPGAANIEEMNQRRFVAAADILAGLQWTQQEPVGREQWERNFMRAYPELEGDTAALDAAWEAAQPAAQQFAENEGRQPMPAVVAQQRGAPVGEGQTSLKNAVADEERRRRGLPPAMQAARQSNAAAWDEAMRVMDERPNAQADLIARQRANPMTPTDNVEQMILLHRTVELENAFDDSVDDINAAVQSGDTVALEAAKQRRTTAAAALTEVRDLIKSTGTSLGRSLQIRRAMMGRDYTLGRMVAEAQAAKESPLTETELDQVETQFTKIKETEAALEAREEEVEQAASDKALDETVAEMEKAAPKEVDPKVKSIADRVIAYFEKRAAAARKRLRSKLQKVGSAPDPTIIVDLADMAAARIGKSEVSFSTWSAEMVQEFGEKVRQFLQDAWSLANSNIDKKVEGEAGPKRKAAVSRRVRKLDATEQRQALQTAMQERLNEGDSIGDLRAYVNRIAESFVASGVKERDAVLDSVMSVVQPLVPDMTRRQLADLISGYGQFKQLDQAEIKREMRDIRGQLQQVSKLEDIEARRPPLKTGVQRREPSTEERRLIKLVNEAKKKYGVVVTDPARQLKSALDAVKTRLRNQIREITTQIETGEKPTSKTPLQYDEQAEWLRGIRDRMRASLAEMEGPSQITEEQRVANATRALEATIAEYERRIKSRDTGPRDRRPKISTPQLEALRARRDALRDELDSLRSTNDLVQEERRAEAIIRSISALEERLASGDVGPRGRTMTADTQLVAELKEQRRVLRDEMARRRDAPQRMTEEERQVAALERQIETLEQQISTGDVSPSGRRQTVDTLAVTRLKAQRDALREKIRKLRPEKPKATEEERQIAAINRQIEEAERRIREGDYEIGSRRATADTKLVSEARERLAAIREAYVLARDSNPRVMAKRLDAAIKAADRTIAELDRKLQAGDVSARSRTPKPVAPEIERKRAEIAAMRQLVTQLRSEARPKRTREEIAIKAAKTRLSNRNAELQERMARQDFAKRERTPVDLSRDPEAVRLKAENERVKQEYEESKRKWELAQRTQMRKIIDGAKEVLSTVRPLVASADLSAVGRQGLVFMAGDIVFNPARASRLFYRMLRSAFSERYYQDLAASISMRPNAPLYQQSGMYVGNIDGDMTSREEHMRSNLAERVPLWGRVLRGSNRAFLGFLNLQRVEVFDSMIDAFGGPASWSMDDMKFFAKGVNTLTGRGNVDQRHVGTMDFLARYFFSPRFIKARIDTIMLRPILEGVADGKVQLSARSLMAAYYLRAAVGMSSILTLAMLAGFDIEDDPRDANFGKIKWGNWIIDPLGGLAQMVTLIARGISPPLERAGIVSKPKKRAMDVERLIGSFIRMKAAPVPAIAFETIKGEHFDGTPVTPTSTAIRAVAPISAMTAVEISRKEQDAAKAAILNAMSALGVGVRYQETKRK